jgi:acetylornithine deacetylase
MNTTPKLQEMVKSIIATPSVSSTLPQFDQSNLAVVNLLANWLEPLGFRVDIKPIPGQDDKANLIATLGTGTGGLVLSGHTDTVPFDAHLWSSDPFKLHERNDRWYGLGVCDMKSFLALCIAAVEPFRQAKLQHPLTILGTADEESSMSGARNVAIDDLNHAKYALIGEPTGLKPINRHKGIMMLNLKVTGSSGHSSDPSLGNNALDATGFVIQELGLFREKLAKDYRDTNFEVVVPTLNLGCIHGGDNPNRICDSVELSFDLRILPGMNGTALIHEIRQRLQPRLEAQGLQFGLDLLHPPVAAFKSSGEQLLKTIQDTHTGTAGSVAFATEAPFLTDLGLETIVMGPGSIDQAHQPNEFLELAQLAPSIAIIRALVNKYCC